MTLMADFYEGLEPEFAKEIELLSHLIYQLRENRGAVLGAYGLTDEAMLLDRIRAGAVAEHPAYEHYLAARILADTREAARSALAERLQDRKTV